MLAILTVLALAAAIGTGYYWWDGTQSENASAAAMRDEAVDAATQIVVNINTVRPNTLEADMNAAQSSLTEPMLGEMVRTPDGWKAAKATPSTGQQ